MIFIVNVTCGRNNDSQIFDYMLLNNIDGINDMLKPSYVIIYLYFIKVS